MKDRLSVSASASYLRDHRPVSNLLPLRTPAGRDCLGLCGRLDEGRALPSKLRYNVSVNVVPVAVKPFPVASYVPRNIKKKKRALCPKNPIEGLRVRPTPTVVGSRLNAVPLRALFTCCPFRVGPRPILGRVFRFGRNKNDCVPSLSDSVFQFVPPADSRSLSSRDDRPVLFSSGKRPSLSSRSDVRLVSSGKGGGGGCERKMRKLDRVVRQSRPPCYVRRTE